MAHITRPDGQLEQLHTPADDAPLSALQLTTIEGPDFAIAPALHHPAETDDEAAYYASITDRGARLLVGPED